MREDVMPNVTSRLIGWTMLNYRENGLRSSKPIYAAMVNIYETDRLPGPSIWTRSCGINDCCASTKKLIPLWSGVYLKRMDLRNSSEQSMNTWWYNCNHYRYCQSPYSCRLTVRLYGICRVNIDQKPFNKPLTKTPERLLWIERNSGY